MNYTKKILSAASVLAIIVSPLSASAESLFEPASVVESGLNTIDVKFSENLNADEVLSLKVIESTAGIAKITRDYNQKNKAIVEFSGELEPGVNYILLSILGGAGNISFSLPDDFSNLELMNERVLDSEKQDIELITVKNSSEIEVTFTSDIEENVSMKLIKNIDVVFSEIASPDTASITLKNELESYTNYTLAVLSATSESGDIVESANSLFDFRTEDITKFQPKEEEIIVVSEEEKPKDIMDVAHRDDNKLPDSGTKENLIIILALIIGAIVVFRGQIIKTV